jgi:protoporphyrin/coproporphyrin ferrochelatase
VRYKAQVKILSLPSAMMSSDILVFMVDEKWAVLLLAHGAPDRLEDIPEFLLNVRGGRALAEPAVQEIVRRYSLIGGGSPLLAMTSRQAEALADRLGCRVYVGMRNWRPFIADAVRRLDQDGVERLVTICLAPQNSRTSIGLYRKHLTQAIEERGCHVQVDFVDSWHDTSELIAAFSEKLTMALDRMEETTGERVPIVFTAHSVPQRTIDEGDPYQAQVMETARLVAQRSGLDHWRVAFQSQGMTSEPWIGPAVESEIDRLTAAGCRHALLVPISFVSDHVEILYDVDIAFRQYGEARGVSVCRSESLNDSPLFITALATVASGRLRAARSGSAK